MTPNEALKQLDLLVDQLGNDDDQRALNRIQNHIADLTEKIGRLTVGKKKVEMELADLQDALNIAYVDGFERGKDSIKMASDIANDSLKAAMDDIKVYKEALKQAVVDIIYKEYDCESMGDALFLNRENEYIDQARKQIKE